MKESETERKLQEEGEVVLGGVEVHVKFARYRGDPGILLDLTPPGRRAPRRELTISTRDWPGSAGQP